MIIFKKFQLVVSMITQLVAYKLIALDLSKLQKLDADSKAIQQISFTWNLDQVGSTLMFNFFHYWRRKRKEQLKYHDFILL